MSSGKVTPLWLADALCAEHAPKSALRTHAAAEAGKGEPSPPPAATEGQGAVSASPAPAPGGPPAGTEMIAVPMVEWTELVETYDVSTQSASRYWRGSPTLEVAEAAEALILASRGVS